MTPQTTPTQTIREEEDEEAVRQVPSFDRSKKPSYNPLSTSIGGGYRMVYVPESISRKFEGAASANTRQNVETCAILAGKLVLILQPFRTTKIFTARAFANLTKS
jgi:hypothetical protein